MLDFEAFKDIFREKACDKCEAYIKVTRLFEDIFTKKLELEI
jgi:hypothetical protein